MTDTYEEHMSVKFPPLTCARTTGGFKYAESPYMASFVKAALTSFAGGLGIEKYPFMIYACR
jgi:hypothetical protein